MAGIFITLEGPDGSGKTSVIQALQPQLEQALNRKVYPTREPGGSPIAEAVRRIILDPSHIEMDDRTEALLFAACRSQHLADIVLPHLSQGNCVLCDRFVDSSVVYQGVGRQLGMQAVYEMNQFATGGLLPDLTLLLDVEAEAGLQRIQDHRDQDDINRLDKESIDFHNQVREGYLDLLEANPDRIKYVDASQELDQVVATCFELIVDKFKDF